MTTELAPSQRRPRAAPRRTSGPDRVTVILLSVAGFLVVLSLLAGQLPSLGTKAAPHRVVVIRRVYETRVIETVPNGTAVTGGSGVTQSVSSSGSTAAATRSS